MAYFLYDFKGNGMQGRFLVLKGQCVGIFLCDALLWQTYLLEEYKSEILVVFKFRAPYIFLLQI